MAFCSPAAFSHRAIRGLLGTVCLLGLMLLSSRTCQASCGDYVMLRGEHLKAHGAAANDPKQVAGDSHSVPAKKTPCNSPVCRGEVPELPVPQPPPQGSSTDKPLALFAESLHLEGGSPNFDWLTSTEHARPGFRSPLERPPSL